LNDSSFPTTVAPERSETPRSFTSGVPPIKAVMSSAILTGLLLVSSLAQIS
jgi:hypothetical protein